MKQWLVISEFAFNTSVFLKTAIILSVIANKNILFIYSLLVIHGERPEESNNALPRISSRGGAMQPWGKKVNHRICDACHHLEVSFSVKNSVIQFT